MKVAKTLGDKYWIYFLGGIDVENGIAKGTPVFYQNPIESVLKSSKLSKTPQGVIVEPNKKIEAMVVG